MSTRGWRRREGLAALGGGLAALGPLATAQARDTLRYGGDAQFAPFESLDGSGTPQGFQIELLAELGLAIDADIIVTLTPWAQTEAAFRAGQLDLVGMVDTPPRRTWALFARAHATPAITIYRPPARSEPQDLQDIAGLRIAVLDREAMRETLRTWLAALPGPFVPCEDAAAALRAVHTGRADVALLPHAYADPVLAADTSLAVVASAMSLQLQPYALAVAPGNEALRERLQAGLDRLEQQGRLDALRIKWLSSHRERAERLGLRTGLARQQQQTWLIAGGASLALLLMGGGLWQRRRRLVAEQARREEAEAALARAEALLEHSFVGHPDAMLVVAQTDGVVVDANRSLLSLLDLTAEAVIGRRLDDQARHLDPRVLDELVQSIERDGSLMAVPLRLTRADGSLRQCLVSADRLQLGGAPQVFCLLRDITAELARDDASQRAYEELLGRLGDSQRRAAEAEAHRHLAEESLQVFTRTVSHDLRTPLNAVQGFAGLLRRRLRDGHVEEALAYSAQIERAGQRMNMMVGALGRLAQVSRQPLRREFVNMKAMAADTWDLIAAARPEPLIEWRLDDLPGAHADAELTAQVWQNLLDNARKYSATQPVPKVSVDSFRDARGTWYRIADNGAGFDMARAGALFQPFQRFHSASQFEGTGVGLSLVRRIVDLHGGEIRLRSAVGVGTVAEFTLDPLPSA